MTKRLVIGACMMALAVTAVSAKAKKVEQGKVLNIYVWNDEFKSRFNDFYASRLPAGVKVNFIQTPNQDNAYQNKLDEALLKQAKAKADEKVDLFCVEADYALKYVNSEATLDVYKDVGLTAKDTANQLQYTKDIMTSAKKQLKGVSWQSTPAGMIYRRSIAKAVLGTDDPAKVQAQVSDMSKFKAVAAKMKAAGYTMVSGYDDMFRLYYDNMKSAFVKGNKIVIDPKINEWIADTKEFTDKGWNAKTSLWSTEWSANMKKNAKVFCFFGPGWFFDYSMSGNAEDNPGKKDGSYGDWAIVKGPAAFSWGGTWICAAAGTDNIDIIKDVMLTLTCDTATLKKIAINAGDCVNSVAAMKEISASGYKNAFLGGQDNQAFFAENASALSKRGNMSMYDQGMVEQIQGAMKDYFAGSVSLDKAWSNFYTAIQEKYPNLQK